MTAVQLVAAGRRYAVDGKGHSTAGRVTRVAGEADIPLDEFLMPMVLASDAVVRDGELIGGPTEGALVVLAARVSPQHKVRLGDILRKQGQIVAMTATASTTRPP